jgi:hypothetical protein
MDPTNPSLSIRPTQSEVRKNLMKDLEKPGYIVILHTGEIIQKPLDPQAVEPAEKP